MEKSEFPYITDPEIRAYCEENTSSPHKSLEALELTNKQLSNAKMISGRFLGRFLSVVSKTVNPLYILEIGTFTGYGTLCLAEGLREGGKIITIERNEEMAHYHKSFAEEMGLEASIERIIGDAMEILPKLDYRFNLVFIDAAKRKYIDFYEMVLPKMPSGGIILADNTLWKGKMVTDNNDKLGTALKEFNKHVTQDERVENILLPIDDGVHYIRKK